MPGVDFRIFFQESANSAAVEMGLHITIAKDPGQEQRRTIVEVESQKERERREPLLPADCSGCLCLQESRLPPRASLGELWLCFRLISHGGEVRFDVAR
jgi:hypothetical protein